jgi:hypothetical protein
MFFLSVLFAFVSCYSICATDSTLSTRVPIQAELIGKLDAAQVKTGDAVYAKVRARQRS